ncbi:MAG: iron-sulfur cluster assembly protein IscA [Myxococcales bacterium]|nr:iron-sulfur cluster assembly protein IscA [Myxococcales bacterium]
MTITMTPGAAKQVKAMMQENGLEGHVVRVAIASATVEGLTYELDIVDEVKDSDRSFESDGVRVVIDPRSYLHLRGTRVDWTGSGFSFDNPNA